MSNSSGVVSPPPGVTPDFNSSPWLLTANRIAVVVGVALCTLSLLMRLYTKAHILRKFGWDDGEHLHDGFHDGPEDYSGGSANAVAQNSGSGSANAVSQEYGAGSANSIAQQEGGGTADAYSLNVGDGSANSIAQSQGAGSAGALALNVGSGQSNAIAQSDG